MVPMSWITLTEDLDEQTKTTLNLRRFLKSGNVAADAD
jgi:hypothetical protein